MLRYYFVYNISVIPHKFIFQLVCERSNLYASVCAIARAFPCYTRKSNPSSRSTRTVHIEIILASPAAEGQLTEVVSDDDLVCLKQAMRGVRLAAKITDMPCSEMHTDAFIQVSTISDNILTQAES